MNLVCLYMICFVQFICMRKIWNCSVHWGFRKRKKLCFHPEIISVQSVRPSWCGFACLSALKHWFSLHFSENFVVAKFAVREPICVASPILVFWMVMFSMAAEKYSVLRCENKDTLLWDVLCKRRIPSRNFSFLVSSGCTSYTLQLLKYSPTHLKGERSTDYKNLNVYSVTSQVRCGLVLQNDLCIQQFTLSLMTLVKEPGINSTQESCRGAHYSCAVTWI